MLRMVPLSPNGPPLKIGPCGAQYYFCFQAFMFNRVISFHLYRAQSKLETALNCSYPGAKRFQSRFPLNDKGVGYTHRQPFVFQRTI